MENVQDINITAPDKPPKNKGGRPYKYTVEDFKLKTEEYIAKRREENKPITKNGLSLYIGCDPDTITNLSSVEGYSGAIKRVVQAGEEFEVEYIHSGKNPVGAIFTLKNLHGWTDKQEISTTNTNIMLIANPDDAAQLLSGIAGYFQATEKNVTPALSSAVVVDSEASNARSDGKNAET